MPQNSISGACKSWLYCKYLAKKRSPFCAPPIKGLPWVGVVWISCLAVTATVAPLMCHIVPVEIWILPWPWHTRGDCAHTAALAALSKLLACQQTFYE